MDGASFILRYRGGRRSHVKGYSDIVIKCHAQWVKVNRVLAFDDKADGKAYNHSSGGWEREIYFIGLVSI